jgi:tetratricopeptide (TPR) repeat protein
MRTHRSMRSFESLMFMVALLTAAGSAGAQDSSYLTAAREAAKAAPRDAAAQVALGEALLEARLLTEAKAAFGQASRLPEGRVSGVYGLAKIQMVQDDIPGARRTCKQLVSASKGGAIGYVCDGEAFLAWQRSSRAVEGFEKALSIEPNNVDALIGMGYVDRAQGDVAKSESGFRKAIAAAPGSARAQYGLGELLMGVDRMSDAQAAFREAIRIAPGMADPHYQLGILLGDSDAGIAELRKAVEIRPAWGEALEALGQVVARKGNHEEAITILDRAVKANPNLAGAFQQLGLSHAALKQWPQAEASLRTAIKLVPSLSQAVTTLGDVLAEEGLHDDALATYEQARDLSPSDALVPLHMGKLFRTLARNTLATAQFNKALQLDAQLGAAEMGLGDIAFEEEDWIEARAHYEAASKAAKRDGVDQEQLRARLQQLKQR